MATSLAWGHCESASFGHIGADHRPGRQKDKRKHHRKVFDNQPADSDAATFGLNDAAFLEGAEENDSRGDGKSKTEDDPLLELPVHEIPHAHAEKCRSEYLGERAGDGDGADGEQVLERKV